jgi:hypothetical protein
MTGEPATDQHVPLGATGWALWRDACLRGAGFPAAQVQRLCDQELAEAADAVDEGVPATRERYAKVFTAATDRLSAAVRRTAADPAFREAVTWQNPALVHDCLDKAAAGEPRNVRGRYHELTIAMYLQRYCLKNDTIGFFGPVGWARIGDDDTGLSAEPGPSLLAHRSTYFEGWAVDAVSEVIASRAEVWPWLRPAVSRSAVVGGRVLRLPFRRPVTLTAAEVGVLGRCDGHRTVRDIAGVPPDPACVAALLRLRELGALRIDLQPPLIPRPERELAERIDTIADPAVRAQARTPLDELVAGRDAVTAAAGDPERLLGEVRALAETFGRITGRAPTRRSGAIYAGRTLVYEDTVRAGEVRVGRRVTDRLAPALGLVLDSALWLANTVADRYEALARQILDRELARTGGTDMALVQLLGTIMPEFGKNPVGRPESAIVDTVMDELRERWRRALALPLEAFDRTSRHQVAAEAIAGPMAAEFATGPPRWSGAGWHSPDVMLVPDGTAGDVQFVLGELHCASNTLNSQFFVTQHPAPERLRDSVAASGLGRRVVTVPRLDSPVATSRMAPATELMLADWTYVCMGAEAVVPPPEATVVSAQDLRVRRHGDELVVHHHASGAEHSFLEVAGDALSVLVADALRPLGGARHAPRLTIDALVVSREAWTLRAGDVSWAFVKDEQQRYAGARRWRSSLALPERVFARVPVERKPAAVDFRSLPLVNLLAKIIRRTAAEPGDQDVTVTETLPGVEHLWLGDAAGERYTAELRLVAVRTR